MAILGQVNGLGGIVQFMVVLLLSPLARLAPPSRADFPRKSVVSGLRALLPGRRAQRGSVAAGCVVAVPLVWRPLPNRKGPIRLI